MQKKVYLYNRTAIFFFGAPLINIIFKSSKQKKLQKKRVNNKQQLGNIKFMQNNLFNCILF